MGLFTKDQFAAESEDVGIFVSDLGRALVIWRAMQDREIITVADAATIFNTSPAVIREAIDEAMWIGYLGPTDEPTKQIIEVDGE